MEMNFSLSNDRHSKIKNLFNVLNRRINRLEDSIHHAQLNLISDANKISNLTGKSDKSLHELQVISSELDNKLNKQMSNIGIMNNTVQAKINSMENGLKEFAKQQFTQEELKFEIDKTIEVSHQDYEHSNQRFYEEYLVAKIHHHSKKSISEDTRKSLVRVNNEIEHINNLLTEIREETIQMINDYNHARLGSLQNELRKSHVAESFMNSVEDLLLREQISAFKSALESIGITEQPIKTESTRIVCSCGGIGRTAFC